MNQIEKDIPALLKGYSGIVSAYLYGSEASGHSGPGSDIDIALLYERSNVPSFSEKMEIEDKMTSALEKEVDLLILNTASPVIRMQVLRKGKKLFDFNHSVTNNFFVQTVNEYCDLKMTRSVIEKSLGRTGIYG